MAIAGALQQDSAGQKFSGPVDPATGAGKAQRAANVDSTAGYGDAAVVLYSEANKTVAKAEDTAHASADPGIMALAVRKDVAAALAGSDADYAPLEVDASGRLHAILSASEKAEDSAHQSGDTGIMALTVRKDTPAATAGTAGDYQPAITDATGRTWTRNKPDYLPKATLQAAGAIAADGTVNGDPVTGFGGYKQVAVVLTVAAKNLAGGGTLNVYVQTSPDDGTTWDDVISFTQITNAAVANGTYMARISNNAAAGEVDRANKNATLTANNIVNYFCDQLRVVTKAASMNGTTDTVNVKVEAVAFA